jgi:anti-anti-sigma factor
MVRAIPIPTHGLSDPTGARVDPRMGATMGPAEQLTVRVESVNGVARIVLSGELDVESTQILQQHLARSEEDDITATMLDLRDLSFLDSTGLHALVEAKERAEASGRRLILIGASASSRRMIELTNTRFLLDEDAVDVMSVFTEPRLSSGEHPRWLTRASRRRPTRPSSER